MHGSVITMKVKPWGPKGKSVYCRTRTVGIGVTEIENGLGKSIEDDDGVFRTVISNTSVTDSKQERS